MQDKDQIIILVCANPPNQKFWDGNSWTDDIDRAVTFLCYENALEVMWNIPNEWATSRITTFKSRAIYKSMLEYMKLHSKEYLELTQDDWRLINPVGE